MSYDCNPRTEEAYKRGILELTDQPEMMKCSRYRLIERNVLQNKLKPMGKKISRKRYLPPNLMSSVLS